MIIFTLDRKYTMNQISLGRLCSHRTVSPSKMNQPFAIPMSHNSLAHEVKSFFSILAMREIKE